jgi:hypothetical protein
VLNGFILVLALCGDGGYRPEPIPLCFDRAIVQDVIDNDESFIQKRYVIRYRVIHLFNWYDDVCNYVYEGWVLVRQDRCFMDHRYPFFQKFIGKWWELRVKSIQYEMSDRRIEETDLRVPKTFQLKESGS